MPPLGRPVRADDVFIKILDHGVDHGVPQHNAVGYERQNRARPSHPARLGVKRRLVEPMRRLRGDDEIRRRIRQAAPFRRRDAIRHPLARLGVLDLLGARVRGDDALEAIGQQNRELPRAAAAIEGEVRGGADRREIIDKLRRVRRPVGGIIGGAA